MVDNDMTDEEYSRLCNALWSVVSVRPDGDFHLVTDGRTSVDVLNDQYDQDCQQHRWQ